MIEQKFSNRTVLITGGGSGIGRATALCFGREGARVIVSDINASAGEETVEIIRSELGEATFFWADTSVPDTVKDLIERGANAYGRIHHAVNNAGVISGPVRLADYEEVDWDLTMNVNLKGVWSCLKYEIRHMVQQGGGTIVNLASTAGLGGLPFAGGYSASKAGVLSLTRTAAMEYAVDGIRINAVCPGGTQTPMMTEIIAARPEMTETKMSSPVPMARLASPDEVAAAIMWLSSDQSSFVTGIGMPVDGGLTAG